MSGTIVDNLTRTSGTIAPTSGGLSWSSDVITASTATVSAGNGYWINTTSNACTVTLPSSADIGDKIVLADYDRTWATNNLVIDSNGLNFQGSSDAFTVDYSTAGQSLSIVYSDATKGWIPISDDAVTDAPTAPVPQKGIFAYGKAGGSSTNQSQIISSSGVVQAVVTGVGTARNYAAGSTYGGDKGIFGFGEAAGGPVSITNLVNNSGVIATDTAGVGSIRYGVAACTFGVGKAIFGYGYHYLPPASSAVSTSNLVSTSGVVASDTSGVGTARNDLAACGYGLDKGIFGFGIAGSITAVSNLVNNVGVVATDTSGVGTARQGCAASTYGSTGQAIFGFGTTGTYQNVTNLVSTSGVEASDTTGVGTARRGVCATRYGGDKAIFVKGGTASNLGMSNLVSNTGVVASDVASVGVTGRDSGACSFSYTS